MNATNLKIIAVICMTLDHLSTYLGAPLPARLASAAMKNRKVFHALLNGQGRVLERVGLCRHRRGDSCGN